METLEPLLAAHPFFQGFTQEDIKFVTGCARNVRFNAGQTLFQAGGEADCFYLIRSGRVALEVYVPGRGAVVIQTVEEGDIVGWSWLFPPHVWKFDAKSLELTRALALDGKCLRAKCEADPRLGYELMKRVSRVMTERLEATRLQLIDVYGTRD